MGRITTGIGLVSGINSKDIIDQLMTLEARPKDILKTRVDGLNQQKLAYADLSVRLTSIKLFGTSVKKPQTFAAASTASSDENVLTATAANGASIGSFQFQVSRLVTTQQSISKGFVDVDNARIGAGTLTIEQGGGEASNQTLLSQLRGGEGVRRGVFRLTDSSGKSAVIDTTAAVSVDDVIKKINSSLDVSVRASISGDKLKLTDLAGGLGTLGVLDLADGHSAEDLGLTGIAPVLGVITGGDINFLGRSTTLNNINDGRGIRRPTSGNDLAITVGGSTYNVNLASSKTVGDVIDTINTATGNVVKASITPGNNGLTLTSTGGAFTVASLTDSKVAEDLGIVAAGVASLEGRGLLAGINTVLVSSLNGGQGLTLGSIQVTNAAGASATVDLSAAQSVQDILDGISNSGISVKGALNAAGNGIQIVDSSGGTGALTVAEAGGTTALDLGVLGAAASGKTAINGKNLQRQWVSENTLLNDYNGGKGITPGKFKITNSLGAAATINLSTGTKFSLGDVMQDINARNLGVRASINTQGDGLLLTDTAGGSLKLKVEDTEGTSATDLNIAGEATATTIDGSFEKTVTVTATDTLTTLQTKLSELNFGVIAQVINDGSGTAPFRLSLTAKNTGRNGRVVFDSGATNLNTRNLVDAQDAAVFLGGTGTAEPLLITAGNNQIAGVIKGVTIDLHGISDKPVTLGVTRDTSALVTQAGKFVEDFNALTAKIKELTKFDPETGDKGILLGDSTIRSVEANVFTMLTTVVKGAGQYRILADIGIRLGQGAQVEFDEDKFKTALADDPDGVQKLFTQIDAGIGAKIETVSNKLIDPVSGLITRENKTLDEKNKSFQTRIEQLEKLIEGKRSRLERQFSNLESVLAGLQSQQSALGQIQSISNSSSK